ncbi:response regulator, partial [Streptomyces sp. SID7803]|nr:response regulator [Streptomyces sp. SID7803]
MSPAEDDPPAHPDRRRRARRARGPATQPRVRGGYGTEVAVDGLDALAKRSRTPPDLIVLDIQMPRMDGLTAARRIRSTGATTPILMLTARGHRRRPRHRTRRGRDDYLVKPFELDELF